jgi:hypothetical protein
MVSSEEVFENGKKEGIILDIMGVLNDLRQEFV